MFVTKALARLTICAGLMALPSAIPTKVYAQQTVTIGSTDIGGTVVSAAGPEAGVWVIAETTDLPTKFARIVVTDDSGRYLVPDLPAANYSVWVRGYGLVDSAKLTAKPGQLLNHTAVPAPNEAAAAHYYPAIYWYAMMKIPPAGEFGGKSDIPEKLTQTDWLKQMKNIGCIGCHQLGQEATRSIPGAFGKFDSGAAAWIRRVQSGQSGEQMTNYLAGNFGGAPLKYLGDWTDRVAKGELPRDKPPRPQGVERNIVITSWEWSTSDKYLHDLISSDRRHPTVNAYGPLYGSPEYSTDNMPILDPRTNKVSFFKMPVADPEMPASLGPGHAATVRTLEPSAKVFPLEKSARQVAMLDPRTMKYSFINTCFATHHLQFGYDANDTLWLSGTGPVAGWINTRMFDETGDAAKSQGWSPFVLDTNGNGKRDDHVEPNAPLDPNKDKRIVPGSGPYAVMPSPVDGSIWYTVGIFGGPPGVLRFDPANGLSEVFNVPAQAFGIRGGDIDKDGVVWASMTSGHLGSFDRRKCNGPLNGPTATGNHCPEGWTVYQYPGPGFDGIGENSAESSYYTWVDQHNTLGLGENIPMSTANLGDGFVALKDGKMITIRIPYPLSFYAKGLDGRIDDPNAGWKGRGLWSTNGDRTPWLKEGGKGSRPRAVHIQFRPDPLAN